LRLSRNGALLLGLSRMFATYFSAELSIPAVHRRKLRKLLMFIGRF
jgi:hypothetical protein